MRKLLCTAARIFFFLFSPTLSAGTVIQLYPAIETLQDKNEVLKTLLACTYGGTNGPFSQLCAATTQSIQKARYATLLANMHQTPALQNAATALNEQLARIDEATTALMAAFVAETEKDSAIKALINECHASHELYSSLTPHGNGTVPASPLWRRPPPKRFIDPTMYAIGGLVKLIVVGTAGFVAYKGVQKVIRYLTVENHERVQAVLSAQNDAITQWNETSELLTPDAPRPVAPTAPPTRLQKLKNWGNKIIGRNPEKKCQEKQRSALEQAYGTLTQAQEAIQAFCDAQAAFIEHCKTEIKAPK